MSIETKNHELTEEKISDTKIVPIDVEVNQQNDKTMDKDMPIENTCSVDNISNKMDSEDEITAGKDDVKCGYRVLKDPDWVKECNWRSLPNNGVDEAVKEFMTCKIHDPKMPKTPRYRPTPRFLNFPITFEPSNPVFKSKVNNDPKA
ncbi:uncharacterized protein LOC126555672 [Aphis gossypii]|uniref:uncharacterized protein LOC126555547 n=1 Tax=Aphis gossypii TaxID=80765 RepID=UPI002158A6B0|nr:uncharacterized protein LOC126555547 [Aphis gossypii]XP_050066528.1 uncharacterized protein LOC126555672 [Aphis gossypii]